MARVLVTGGAGFIGSHLCDHLVERGHDVVVIDDFSHGREENLARLGNRLTVIRASVLDLEKHEDALAGVTLIYHLAALISSQDSMASPQQYMDVNVGGVLAVLQLARRLDRPRIVFASSSTVYGNGSGPTCSEADAPAPATVYALSKLAGEHLLSMYQQRDGFEPCSLRLFNVYGPRQSPTHPYANVTCKFAHAAANDRHVKLYGTGAQTRDFVYVDDVVRAFLRAAAPTGVNVCNVGTGKDTSIKSLLATVEEVAGVTLKVEHLPAWGNDIQAIRADVSQLKIALGLEASVSLPDGLRRTVEFFRSAGR